MKREIFILVALLLLSACTREEVRDSVSHSLKDSCARNAAHCSLDDPDAARPDGKGAQK